MQHVSFIYIYFYKEDFLLFSCFQGVWQVYIERSGGGGRVGVSEALGHSPNAHSSWDRARLEPGD